MSNTITDKKNKHLEFAKRNRRIRKILVGGMRKAQIAREYGVTGQRIDYLVNRFVLEEMIVKTDDGYEYTFKGRALDKIKGK